MSTNNKQGGQVVIFSTILFVVISGAVVAGLSSLASRTSGIVRELKGSTQSYYLAESALEDVTYRLKKAKAVDQSESLTLDGKTATVQIADLEGNKELVSTSDVDSLVRKVKNLLTLGTGASFNFGVQSDTGGFVMSNSSEIHGNLYSNGPIVGTNSSIVRGDVVSAGPNGLIDGIHATGTAYAHTIRNARIDGDAYYQSLSMTTVGGTAHPGSPDQPNTPLPISDEKIAEWEADAEAGGVINCPTSPYKITAARTLGPVKINCDVEISGNNYAVTLAGNVWVKGSLNIKNSPTIRIDPAVGNRSVGLIADNPANRLTSSKIILNNSSVFEGTGKSGSMVLMLSQNESSEKGGNEVAISVANSANGDLLVYAGHGEVRLGNSVALKQVTAHRIRLSNYSVVEYETGLASLLFTTGPGGTWKIRNWIEAE